MRRTLGACLAAVALPTTAAACSSSSAVFGGEQPAITGSIHVDSPTVRAGRVVHAELALHNNSSHPILLWRGCSFQFVELVLTKGSATTGAAFLTPLCRPGVTYVAHPGTTIYHLHTPASYGACIMVGHRRYPGNPPQCLRGNRAPPLPAGLYRVTIAAMSKRLQRWLSPVQPARVRVTR